MAQGVEGDRVTPASKCPCCGSDVDEDFHYCDMCGFPLIPGDGHSHPLLSKGDEKR